MQELMCHSCASRNPGCFVPATVFLLGKRELWDTFWIPAFAEMTIQGPFVCHSRESGRPVVSFLDSCLRRNDTSPLHPASLRRPLDSQGRGGLLHSAKVLYIFDVDGDVPQETCTLRRRMTDIYADSSIAADIGQ
jgi:hypothetical protein